MNWAITITSPQFLKRGIREKAVVARPSQKRWLADFSPAGRLPVTFYKSVDQLPSFDDYSMAKRTYRYFSGDPLYSFGYGLSYTTFQYSNPKATAEAITSDGSVTISAQVTNARNDGWRRSAVQLYLTREGVAGASLRELALASSGFTLRAAKAKQSRLN